MKTTFLRDLDACPEARRWASRQPDLETAWRRCRRSDWMLWLLGRLSGEPDSDRRRVVVGAAAAVARDVLPIFEAARPGDGRVRACLDTCDRYARGEATLADMRAAAFAAHAAYATAAYVATSDAALAASAASAAAAFAAADTAAAESAEASASAADYAAARAAAARADARARHADIIREKVPFSTVAEWLGAP